MITNDNNRRAILALSQNDTACFHGSLGEYLIEVLESLETAPEPSEAPLLKAELRFIMTHSKEDEAIGDMEDCIDDWFNSPTNEELEKEALTPPIAEEDYLCNNSSLKNWHVDVIAIVIFLGLVAVIGKVI